MSHAPPEKPPHVRLLEAEFERRLARNPRYSLRAFAKSVGMHPSTLGRILAGKQSPSAKACGQLVAKLKLDEEARQRFLESVVEAKARETRQRLQPFAGRTRLGGSSASEGVSSSRSLRLSVEALAKLRQLTERFLEEAADHAVDDGDLTFRLQVQLAAVTPRTR